MRDLGFCFYPTVPYCGRMHPEGAACMRHSAVTDPDRGESICNLCGVVLTERIVDRTLEGSRPGESSPGSGAGTGPATHLSMYDMGLYTVIGGGNVDSSGRALSGGARSSFGRLRTWDRRSKSASPGRNLGAAFSQLDAIGAKLGIPGSVIEETAYLYRKVAAKGLFRGTPAAPVLAACLYASCRATGTPRSLGDIAGTADVKRTLVSRALRRMVGKLDMRLEQYDTRDFAVRLANNLGLGERTKRRALGILSESGAGGALAGKNPVGLAAASVYLACMEGDEGVSQALVSDLSGISCVTIRNTASEIRRAAAAATRARSSRASPRT